MGLSVGIGREGRLFGLIWTLGRGGEMGNFGFFFVVYFKGLRS